VSNVSSGEVDGLQHSTICVLSVCDLNMNLCILNCTEIMCLKVAHVQGGSNMTRTICV
jgi:hypothetical protein